MAVTAWHFRILPKTQPVAAIVLVTGVRNVDRARQGRGTIGE